MVRCGHLALTQPLFSRRTLVVGAGPIHCQEQGVQLTPMPVLYEALNGQVPVEHVGQNWYVALPLEHPQTRVGYALIKRFVDIVIAILGLVFFAPLLPVLAWPYGLIPPALSSTGRSGLGKGERSSGWSSFGRWSRMPNRMEGLCGPRSATPAPRALAASSA